MRRAIGIVRVSERKGREGESFASPKDQRDRLGAACDRDGLALVTILQEIDVSGGTPLEDRVGLRQAVEAVETGEADVVMVAYFDRLVRSLPVQHEVVTRVEQAGGRVVALDFGEVTNGSAAQWLSGTMIGAVSEYYRRSVKERTREAQVRAVKRGAWMSRYVPPGYTRHNDGRVEPSGDAPAVVDAFKARAAGATIRAVRELLLKRGVDVTYPAAVRLLKSRAYLGEVRFGELVNLAAHAAIVDGELWRAAQRVKPSPGRRANRERLLARLGVLLCGSCGARMSVSSGHNGTHQIYRCGRNSRLAESCPHPVTIAAGLVEPIVVDAVKHALADAEGRASVEDNAREADAALARTQTELDALIELLDPLEPAARRRLDAATAKRDEAQDRVEHLGSQRSVVTINAAADWDRLSLDTRRALVEAVVEHVRVAPGRGADRVTIELVGD